MSTLAHDEQEREGSVKDLSLNRESWLAKTAADATRSMDWVVGSTGWNRKPCQHLFGCVSVDNQKRACRFGKGDCCFNCRSIIENLKFSDNVFESIHPSGGEPWWLGMFDPKQRGSRRANCRPTLSGFGMRHACDEVFLPPGTEPRHAVENRI